jgi:hypothetical protein
MFDAPGFAVANLPVVAQGGTVDTLRNRAQVQAAGNRLAAQVEDVRKALQRCIDSNFIWCKDKSIFAFGVIPVIGQIILLMELPSISRDFPRHHFHKAVRALERTAAREAELMDISEVRQYTADARLAYHVLRARHAGRDYVRNKGGEGRMLRCVAVFNAAAKKAGWSEEKVAGMEALIKTDPESRSLDQNVLSQFESAGGRLCKKLKNPGL